MSRDYRGRRRDDDEDDRPRRRRSRDDHAPSSRRSKKPGKISPLVIGLIAGGGAFAFLIVAVVLYFTVIRDRSGPGGFLGNSPPSGYSTVPGQIGGFTCYLPGEAKSIRVFYNGVSGDQAGIYSWEGRMPGGTGEHQHASATSHRLNGRTLGNSPEELFTELKRHDPQLNTDFFYDITAKNAIIMDGRGGLELRYRAKLNEFGVPSKDPVKLAKHDREGEKGVYFVTTDGSRFFIIKLSVDGPAVAEEMIKIVRDSFRFR